MCRYSTKLWIMYALHRMMIVQDKLRTLDMRGVSFQPMMEKTDNTPMTLVKSGENSKRKKLKDAVYVWTLAL